MVRIICSVARAYRVLNNNNNNNNMINLIIIIIFVYISFHIGSGSGRHRRRSFLNVCSGVCSARRLSMPMEMVKYGVQGVSAKLKIAAMDGRPLLPQSSVADYDDDDDDNNIP